ncbi:type II secretion system protein J [Aquabacterium sp.]|uniref:PulJ/GspJ family protein n=1 Tax=Aquabacterium sp. TaxID=1872578 RepID=UPI0035AEE60E
MRRPALRSPRLGARGFTLIEVLVALLILSVMAGMAWTGVDALLRSRQVAESRLNTTLRAQSTLAQFEADMNAVCDTLAVPPLVFDGATLRVTRSSAGGVQLVAWSLRNGRWQRWASPAVTHASDLSEIWLKSMQLLGNEAAQVTTLSGISQWQFFTFRGNGWSNAQSSGDQVQNAFNGGVAGTASSSGIGKTGATAGTGAAGAASTIARTLLPTGVRVRLTFDPDGGSGLSGTLTRDILMPPQYQ